MHRFSNLDSIRTLRRPQWSIARAIYMKAAMLVTQFEVLEEPSDAIVVGAAQSPGVIRGQVLAKLGELSSDDRKRKGPAED